MSTYLVTSRDGVHFDDGWVYAHQELIPHGQCARAGGMHPCLPLTEVDEASASSGTAPLDELCCPFDHGIIIPASSVISVNGEHLLYYEGRAGYHEKRYAPGFPMAVGVAAWRQHRIVGLRRDPSARIGEGERDQCGVATTKLLDLGSLTGPADGKATALVREGPIYVTVNVGFPGAGPSTSDAGDTGVYVEVVAGCTSADDGSPRPARAAEDGEPRALRTHSMARSVAIRHDSPAAVVRWRTVTGSTSTLAAIPSTQPVALRFTLCGDAKLFAFTLWRGEPPPAGTSAPKAAEAEHASTSASTGVPPLNGAFGGSSRASRADGGGGADMLEGGRPLASTVSSLRTGIDRFVYLEEAGRVRERWLRARWDARAAEMQRHRVMYGRCAIAHPPTIPMVEQPSHGFSMWRIPAPCLPGVAPIGQVCPYSMGAAPDYLEWSAAGRTQNVPTRTSWAPRVEARRVGAPRVGGVGGDGVVNGVDGCRELCRRECPSCKFASISWASYKCVCAETCNVHKLALSQTSDDTHPDLVAERPVVPARGGGTDGVYDWVTFVIDDTPGTGWRRARGVPLRPFPLRLWNTTRAWADDWVEYARLLNDDAYVEPCTSRGKCAVKSGGAANDENSSLTTLSRAGRRALGGLTPGFCAVTNTGGNCNLHRTGSVSIKSLVDDDERGALTWRGATAACTRFCSGCRQCNYMTLSLSADDCSWYSACDLTKLQKTFTGFYSMRVLDRKPPSATKPSATKPKRSFMARLARLPYDKARAHGKTAW